MYSTNQKLFSIILQDDFTLALPTGSELRADLNATTSLTATAVDDVVTITPVTKGVYYLVTRSDAESNWQRLGELHVQTIHDEMATQLRAELDTVNGYILEQQELIQYQVTDPSGTAVTRMTLKSLITTRATLEARLSDYLRVQRGQPPVRLTG